MAIAFVDFRLGAAVKCNCDLERTEELRVRFLTRLRTRREGEHDVSRDSVLTPKVDFLGLVELDFRYERPDRHLAPVKC